MAFGQAENKYLKQEIELLKMDIEKWKWRCKAAEIQLDAPQRPPAEKKPEPGEFSQMLAKPQNGPQPLDIEADIEAELSAVDNADDAAATVLLSRQPSWAVASIMVRQE